jgi:hypothetical protein
LTPQEGYARATAVFLGKVLSVTTLYNPATKLSGPTPYHEVKLQVENSWKLIDRQEVTIITENITQIRAATLRRATRISSMLIV